MRLFLLVLVIGLPQISWAVERFYVPASCAQILAPSETDRRATMTREGFQFLDLSLPNAFVTNELHNAFATMTSQSSKKESIFNAFGAMFSLLSEQYEDGGSIYGTDLLKIPDRDLAHLNHVFLWRLDTGNEVRGPSGRLFIPIKRLVEQIHSAAERSLLIDEGSLKLTDAQLRVIPPNVKIDINAKTANSLEVHTDGNYVTATVAFNGPGTIIWRNKELIGVPPNEVLTISGDKRGARYPGEIAPTLHAAPLPESSSGRLLLIVRFHSRSN
jgi:hypothetical protein